MKVKVILIIMFLLINVMLIGVLYSNSKNSEVLSDKSLDDIRSILSENDISVSDRMMSRDTHTVGITDATSISVKGSAFLENLEKRGVLEQDGTYVLGDSRIMLYENFVHIENSKAVSGNPDEKNAEKIVAEYFDSLGLNFSDARLEKSERKEKTITMKFIEQYGGYDIFDSGATVNITGSNVASADITWYEIMNNHSQNSKTISLAEALLDFASDKSRGKKHCNVSDIALGYSIETTATDVTVSQMIPCVRITTDIGSTFFYDARSPEQ